MTFLDDRGNALTEHDLGFCGKDVIIKPTVVIKDPKRVFLDDYAVIDHYVVIKCGLKMGKHTKIGPHGMLNFGAGEVTMEDFAECGPNCKLITGSNNYRGDDGLMQHGVPPEFSGTPVTGPVVLKEHVVLGANTTVLENTTVPEGVYTGANTLLKALDTEKQPLKAWTLYVGTPCKALGPVDGTKVKAAKAALFSQRYGSEKPHRPF